ncbi:unnamed protein product [Diatraea saccharalis]|uniref:Uncharacterized protein n=1 Tax=Diatraea saccharalis TaxID=40085 RepID=A0A9N9WHN1_9NEOP|nr:unnamed protein product [Diatraea saccharalis]
MRTPPALVARSLSRRRRQPTLISTGPWRMRRDSKALWKAAGDDRGQKQLSARHCIHPFSSRGGSPFHWIKKGKDERGAVTNALRETLLSFGGSVATDLMGLHEQEPTRGDVAPDPQPDPAPVALPAPAPVPAPAPIKPEPKPSPPARAPPALRKEMESRAAHGAPLVAVPVAKAHPMPAALPPARAPPRPPAPPHLPPAPPHMQPPAPAPPPPAPPQLRPNSNVSFVLQPVMPPLYGPPRLAPPHAGGPHVFPNAYYECSGPWHFYESYERAPGNVNLNFNLPPKSLVVNGRGGSVECRAACREGELPYPPQPQGCWIKPTIFYDGFWTEQKVKKWVAEQVEKQFPEDAAPEPSPAPPDHPKP